MFLQTLRKGAFPLAAQAKVLPPPHPPESTTTAPLLGSDVTQ